MRKIRFRAYDKADKVMKYFSCGIFNRVPDGVEDLSELMQFTGMYDKNGTEIYEGDIVKDCDTRRVKEVLYHLQAFVFKDNRGFFQWTYHTDEHEVIGNIHDNPELVKEELK